MAVTISEQVKQLGLETHVLELEVDRLIVVPPEVHGIAMDRFDTWWNCSWRSRSG